MNEPSETTKPKKTSILVKIVGIIILSFGVFSFWTEYQERKIASELPKCDSPEIIKTLDKIVGDSAIIKLLEAGFTLSMHAEYRYRETPPRRICRAQLETKERGTEALYYSIDWQDKEKGIYWIQTLGSEDDGK